MFQNKRTYISLFISLTALLCLVLTTFTSFSFFNVKAQIYTPTEIINNGNFENGLANWTLTGNPTITTTQAHSPTHSCYLPDDAPTDSIKQMFTAPINKSNMINFTCWLIRNPEFDHIDIIIIHDGGISFDHQVASPSNWMKINILGWLMGPGMESFIMIEGVGIKYHFISSDVYTDDISLFTNVIVPPPPPPPPDYSGFYFKIGIGIISIIALILAPVIADKTAKTTFGKIFLWFAIWLFFGFLFYTWIYMW